MSWRNDNYYKNTGPVPNLARFFNKCKNPEYFLSNLFEPQIKDPDHEKSRRNILAARNQSAFKTMAQVLNKCILRPNKLDIKSKRKI